MESELNNNWLYSLLTYCHGCANENLLSNLTRIICGRRVRVELSSGKTRREMAETTNGRYGPPRDGGRFTPPPRGRSPRRSPPPRGGRGAGDPYHRYDEPFHRGGREAPPRRAMRSR